MNFQLFAQSPLLALPLFALFTFLAVFLSVAVRAFTAPAALVQSAACLPLADEGVTRHEA